MMNHSTIMFILILILAVTSSQHVPFDCVGCSRDVLVYESIGSICTPMGIVLISDDDTLIPVMVSLNTTTTGTLQCAGSTSTNFLSDMINSEIEGLLTRLATELEGYPDEYGSLARIAAASVNSDMPNHRMNTRTSNPYRIRHKRFLGILAMGISGAAMGVAGKAIKRTLANSKKINEIIDQVEKLKARNLDHPIDTGGDDGYFPYLR